MNERDCIDIKVNFFYLFIEYIYKRKGIASDKIGYFMQPRLIRLRDAPRYLGMDRNRFNAEVRPYLITLKIGQQGIAFDRFDLDKWADSYKQQQGLPAKRRMEWGENDYQGSLNEVKSGISIKESEENEFQKVLEHVILKKPNVT